MGKKVSVVPEKVAIKEEEKSIASHVVDDSRRVYLFCSAEAPFQVDFREDCIGKRVFGAERFSWFLEHFGRKKSVVASIYIMFVIGKVFQFMAYLEQYQFTYPLGLLCFPLPVVFGLPFFSVTLFRKVFFSFNTMYYIVNSCATVMCFLLLTYPRGLGFSILASFALLLQVFLGGPLSDSLPPKVAKMLNQRTAPIIFSELVFLYVGILLGWMKVYDVAYTKEDALEFSLQDRFLGFMATVLFIVVQSNLVRICVSGSSVICNVNAFPITKRGANELLQKCKSQPNVNGKEESGQKKDSFTYVYYPDLEPFYVDFRKDSIGIRLLGPNVSDLCILIAKDPMLSKVMLAMISVGLIGGIFSVMPRFENFGYLSILIVPPVFLQHFAFMSVTLIRKLLTQFDALYLLCIGITANICLAVIFWNRGGVICALACFAPLTLGISFCDALPPKIKANNVLRSMTLTCIGFTFWGAGLFFGWFGVEDVTIYFAGGKTSIGFSAVTAIIIICLYGLKYIFVILGNRQSELLCFQSGFVTHKVEKVRASNFTEGRIESVIRGSLFSTAHSHEPILDDDS